MFAEIVAWSFAQRTGDAARRTALAVLAPALAGRPGFHRWLLVPTGVDAYLTVTLFASRKALERGRRALMPLVRVQHGRIVESMERFSGEVVAQVVKQQTQGQTVLDQGGSRMAIAAVFEIRCNEAQYDDVMRRLADAGEGSPPGRQYHVAGPAAAGWRVVDVWDSPELLQRFAGTLVPIMQAAGIPPVEPEIFPVHAIVQGGVTAAR